MYFLFAAIFWNRHTDINIVTKIAVESYDRIKTSQTQSKCLDNNNSSVAKADWCDYTLLFPSVRTIKFYKWSGACLKQQNQPNTGTTQYFALVMVY
jgi:hypothetical protein